VLGKLLPVMARLDSIVFHDLIICIFMHDWLTIINVETLSRYAVLRKRKASPPCWDIATQVRTTRRFCETAQYDFFDLHNKYLGVTLTTIVAAVHIITPRHPCSNSFTFASTKP
jgi:hypothetical protein